MKRFLAIAIVFISLFYSVNTMGQNRMHKIEDQLELRMVDMPGLSENVMMSVSGVSIQEFMRGIAEAHKLNISVDPSIEQSIVNNFNNATVRDVLIFVCEEYDLQINFIGSIVSLVKYEVPEPEKVETPKK